jgi:hypothetical protein
VPFALLPLGARIPQLYRLAKESGKLVTQLRGMAAETSAAFAEQMESNLALTELTKAQQELSDAFAPFQARRGMQGPSSFEPPPQMPFSTPPVRPAPPRVDGGAAATSPDGSNGDSSLMPPDLEAPAAAVDAGASDKFVSQLSGVSRPQLQR